MQSIMQFLCCLFYTKSILFYAPSTCSTFDIAKVFVLNIYRCIKDIKEELEGLTVRCKELWFLVPTNVFQTWGYNFAQLIL